jgi:hypothetical protein
MPWATADDGCDVFYETHGISGRRRVGPVARRYGVTGVNARSMRSRSSAATGRRALSLDSCHGC